MKEYLPLKCECGSEYLEIEHYPEYREFIMVQFKYQPLRYTFGRRLKFLFTGEIEYNEIYLSEDKAKQLADYINTNIKNNG